MRLIRLVSAALTAIVVTLALAGTASAHTGFESSTPSNGAVVDDAVGIVTIVFSGEATPVGDEFVARDAAGEIRVPNAVTTVDNRLFNLTFDPPLAGGTIGLRWNVQAADAHPIEGAFSFTVNAPLPTASTVAPPTTVASSTTLAAPTSTVVSAAESTSTTPAPTAPSSTLEPTPAGASEQTPPTDSQQSLAEFLTVDQSRPGETTATIGRMLGLLGLVVGFGALAFAWAALRADDGDARIIMRSVQVLGAVLALGAGIEYVGLSRAGGESLASLWSSSSGVATVFRAAGGLGLAAAMAAIGMDRGTQRSLSAAALGDHDIDAGHRAQRRQPGFDRAKSIAAFAAMAVLASFWFDGHTVSRGFRPLHAAVNTVHVAAATIWVGGLVALTAVAWRRRRRGAPSGVAEMVVRFSKVATIALAAVVVAGAVMAVMVLDSFTDLTGTQWGQVLLLKTAAVALAMIGGAYNHFRLVPALEADQDAPELLRSLRSALTAEAIVLVFALTVTAWLVTSATGT